MNSLLKRIFRRSKEAGESVPLKFEALEPRVLFSATSVDPLEQSGSAHHSPPLVQEEAPAFLSTENPAVARPAEASPIEVTAPPGGAETLIGDINVHAADIESHQLRETVFISTDVDDYEYIAGNIDPAFEVYLIDSESDGVEQIARALEGTSGVDAI
nr:DUF4347 domain-containing protein [Verrucomicrobiales bacterium]